MITRLVERVGATIMGTVEDTGRYMRVLFLGLLNLFRAPMRVRLTFKQMEFVGNQSLSIVLITGLFTGAVFALQSHVAFSMFGADSLTGSTGAPAAPWPPRSAPCASPSRSTRSRPWPWTR